MNKKNNILDYEQVKQKLHEICLESGNRIKKQKDLAITKYGLPIEHYTFGHGKKDFVITGAMHGAEIITTDFVLQLMQELIKKNGKFANLNIEELYTFHIIPILCPEGYVITTSALREIIPRSMSLEEAEKICKLYWTYIREDDQNLKGDYISPRKSQELFKNVDWQCISAKYEGLRNSVKNIYEKYKDLPKGSMIIWNANGSGIDINANSKNNPVIQRILSGEDVYFNNGRLGNVNYSHPGPINCPMDKDIGFEEQIETRAIRELLEKLHAKGTLAGYENYHSTGGAIFQRPCRGTNDFSISDDLYWRRLVNNIFAAYSYQNKTIRQYDENGKPQKYTIYKDDSTVTTVNDEFRMLYESDLLIELSGMGGNPISPYGDIEGNYKRIINSNLEAFAEYIKNYEIIKKISNKSLIAFSNIFKDYKKAKTIEARNEIIEENSPVAPIKKGIYTIAELMVKETHQFIKDNRINELNKLLENGFFKDNKDKQLIEEDDIER